MLAQATWEARRTVGEAVSTSGDLGWSAWAPASKRIDFAVPVLRDYLRRRLKLIKTHRKLIGN